ncbi:hypothetical protein V5O48_015573 [Marasmius crinis-equi]|uniref:Transcription factor TFIIIC triple barrel domain-containing protein n=1 Tax=Marasmius crinis-equi TaxID=585013 RepID=A0ABR3EU61_9AGAR
MASQVQDFGPEDDYEDEEVTYVTVELENVEPTLIASSENMRLIGLDTPTPFMQLSGTILKGHHDTLIGSELLFMENKEDSNRSKRHLTYVGSTSQRLRFKEVQLRSKQEEPSEGQTNDDRSVVTSKEKRKQSNSGAREESAGETERATGKAPAQKKRKGRRPKNDNDGESDYPERSGKKGRKSSKKGMETVPGDEGNVDPDDAPRRSKRNGTSKRKRTNDEDIDEEVDGED